MSNDYMTIQGLAHDLCEGLDAYKEETMIGILQRILADGEYTLEALWRINNEDSGILFDIISYYE